MENRFTLQSAGVHVFMTTGNGNEMHWGDIEIFYKPLKISSARPVSSLLQDLESFLSLEVERGQEDAR